MGQERDSTICVREENSKNSQFPVVFTNFLEKERALAVLRGQGKDSLLSPKRVKRGDRASEGVVASSG